MQVSLRRGEQTLGTIIAAAGEVPRLEHDLTFEQLRMRPHVAPFDESGQLLKIKVGPIRQNVEVAFYDNAGVERLGLRKDDFGFLDLADSKAIAGVRAELTGAGSAGDQPVVASDFVLELGPFEKVRIFGRRISDLYRRVGEWIAGSSLKTERHDHWVTEAPYGSYNIPKLELIRGDGSHLASLVPMGAEVIAAEGRIELIGTRERQPLLYFAAGGPHINVTVDGGAKPAHISHPVFRGVTSEGWYWLEDVRLGRARPLDATLFKDLLRTVSDLYEF